MVTNSALAGGTRGHVLRWLVFENARRKLRKMPTPRSEDALDWLKRYPSPPWDRDV